MELTGKRKALGAQVENGWNDGKKYRLVDKREDASSDNEVVAAKQPCHTR
jgi:hypothetical protein